MALNLGGLSAYVDQLSSELISRTILEGETIKHISIQPGIKYSMALNELEHSLTVQSDNCSSAGFLDSGTTTLSQRNITVCPIKLNNQYCIYGSGGLSDYWMGQLMKAGSYHDTIPSFEESFIGYIIKLWNQEIDKNLWVGSYKSAFSTNSHSADTFSVGYQNNCTGLLYNIFNTSASASTVTTTYSGTPTAANAIAIVDAMVANIPEDILIEDDLVIFVAPQTVQNYKMALKNSNNFHFYVSDSTNADGSAKTNTLTQMVPGTNIQMVGVIGLKGFNGMILSKASNFVMGTDLLNDFENIHVYYSEDYDSLRIFGRFRMGSQIKFPQYVVTY